MKLLLNTFFLILFITGCTPTRDTKNEEADQTTADTTTGPTLLWSDEFDTPGPVNAQYWTNELGDGCPNLCGWGNQELQLYTDKPENIRVEDGKLVIEAIKKDGVWTSARIKTQGKFNFTYGKIEFSAKMPEGVGTWPALWLLGENITEKGWPACGEIDVMEFAGKDPETVQCALHSPSSFGNTQNKKEVTIANLSTEFHTYVVDRTPESMAFYFDGEKIYEYSPEVVDEKTFPYTDPQFIIINLAIGGNLGSEPQLETEGKKDGVDPALEQARFEVDYVRVYK